MQGAVDVRLEEGRGPTGARAAVDKRISIYPRIEDFAQDADDAGSWGSRLDGPGLIIPDFG